MDGIYWLKVGGKMMKEYKKKALPVPRSPALQVI